MSGDETSHTTDHWWWRPGWAQGRTFYTWHLTFDGQDAVHKIAAAYRGALAPVQGWDLVPDQWLHLTMQGIGFVDEIEGDDVQAIVIQARERLKCVDPFDLVLTRPVFTPEAIRWDPDSVGPAKIRDALRESIRSRLVEVPEEAEGFSAHVTIAYSNAVGSAEPALEAIAAVPEMTAAARITHAELIVLNRDHRMYEWETYARIPLGGS